ncbi:MAG: deoxyribonuclease IV [Candidatus Chromulinivorax sp.]|nr:deoxyribonuclease IV [Candidatus Chromulinivorax sp.]
MKEKNQYLVGAHVSISGGFYKAIEEGTAIGCTAIQIFTKSNRQWGSKTITDHEAQQFIDAQNNSDIKVVVAHASYLINLGSTTPGVQEKSLKALVDEIKRCQQLQIPYLVLHPGTAEADSREASIKETGKLINQALEQTHDCTTTILVETMAGQGKSIGSTFEELAAILHQVTHKKRIGICFDTCHAFAAGYDFTTKENYNSLFKKFDDLIGLEYLKIFHVNDSKKEMGAHVDRHEDIGKGAIKLPAFEMIMNDHRFAKVSKILETPVTGDAILDYKRNLEMLVSLIK